MNSVHCTCVHTELHIIHVYRLNVQCTVVQAEMDSVQADIESVQVNRLTWTVYRCTG